MKRLRFLFPLLLTAGVVFLLDRPLGALPALGRLLDPVNGALAAAEETDRNWTEDIRLPGLAAPVQVWVDSALIPHVRAGNDHDLYYVQGYVHARFRLWQMDMQTRAAGGRIAEVAGPKAIDFDRGMRREGMVWGAQRSLKAMEAEPRTKAMLDAYRDGINAFIQETTDYFDVFSGTAVAESIPGYDKPVLQRGGRKLPVEYKLMGFRPEPWTNLRTALLMKYMARDLTGKTDDIAFTQLRDALGQEAFDFLFPERIAGSKPVIPEGTPFAAPSLKAPAVPVGNIWTHFGKPPGHAAAIPTNPAIVATRGGAVAATAKASAATAKASTAAAMASLESAKGPKATAEASATAAMTSSGSAKGSAVTETTSKATATAIAETSLPVPVQETEGAAVGSNNWAVSGKHTASGKPILCNDPHLGLNLPALWFEMQLTAPGINVYGASLPGAPGIVIGFNEKISWGFTNNYRDVKDFYRVTPQPPKGGGYTAYLFNGKEVPFGKSVERIRVKGEADVLDTVLYTIHGPVTYDESFPAPGLSDSTSPPSGGGGILLACTWMGHRGTNELLSVYLLNRAADYDAFTRAIRHFECPAQNFAYADGAGNIAMWGQGRFINKWKGQGKYVMEGRDSSTLWGQSIPMEENPHVLNPPQGYVASANQQVTDSTYPYWYNGSFTEWRSWEINYLLLDKISEVEDVMTAFYEHNPNLNFPHVICRMLTDSSARINVTDMQYLQNARWSLLNWNMLFPLKLSKETINAGNFWPFHKSSTLEESGAMLNAHSLNATVAQIFWSGLYNEIWEDEFVGAITGKSPSAERTMYLLLSDSTSVYYDDKRTPQRETLHDIVQRARRETDDSLSKVTNKQRKEAKGLYKYNPDVLQWAAVKNTTLTHLAKIPAFSYDHLKIGGWSNTINAVTGNHGPSWRMIVEMDSVPRAYTIYPGGQSGNPGSRHYGDFIDAWVEGRYHEVRFLAAAQTTNPLPYTWTLHP